MTADQALAVSGLRLSVRGDEGTAKILDFADLVVRKGSIVGLVGESGCGKSTIIRAVLGTLPETATVEKGEIRLLGDNLLAMNEADLNRTIRGRKIGFIPQDPYLAFNPVFSVGDQILEIMRTHRDGFSEEQNKKHLLSILKRVQIPSPEQALERYPDEFSGGQRQRLLIAAALVCAPMLILADEPTTALDVTTQKEILVLLRELVDEFGIALTLVTHDLGVVAELCDDVVVMYAGQTVESGPMASVLNHPAHPYTRALLACHPDMARKLVGIPGSVPSALHPPPGCRFSPRCSHATSDCGRRGARWSQVANGHLANCILYDAAENDAATQ